MAARPTGDGRKKQAWRESVKRVRERFVGAPPLWFGVDGNFRPGEVAGLPNRREPNRKFELL